MAMNWMGWAALAVFLVAAWAASCAFMLRATRRTVAHQQLDAERKLTALALAVKAVQVKVAELSEAREPGAIIATEFDLEAAPSARDESPRLQEQEVTAEIMAVIVAAATAFLGKKVRILSAKLLESPQEAVNAWSQQGRMFVQASHNLRSRG